MIKELKKYPKDYILLGIILISASYAYLNGWPDQQPQQIAAAVLSLLYFVWGIMHHKIHDHLTFRVVLEYFFVSTFAGALLILLTLD